VIRFTLFVILFISFACRKQVSSAEEKPIDPLARGINLSNWFNDYSDPAQYYQRFPAGTLQFIKSKGFSYVRIPVGSTVLFSPTNPDQLAPAALAALDTVVRRATMAGLAVMLNLHPSANTTDSLLANDAAFVQKIARYWTAVAGYFSKYPADKIFFEVYNEPHAAAAGLTTQSAAWWQPVQQQLISAIRSVAPAHTIIAGGEGWNSIEGLRQLVPGSDKNIIYNFHFYDPFLFTHQGASWAGWQPAIEANQVPWPSSPAAVAPLINGANSATLNSALQWYGDQRYTIDSLDAWVKRAYDWAQQKGVRIIVNEFGSYAPFAPRSSRLRWIQDVRTVFEKYKIGWAMWECDEGFGWISYPGGNRNNPVADAALLQALGL